MHRMKAVRSPFATALVVVAVMLNGCGPIFGPEGGPSAPVFDPIPGTYTEHIWVSIDKPGGQVYMTTDPTLDVLQFGPMGNGESIFVGDDLTLRAYVIDDRGLRSPITVAEYIIEDTAAPVISSTAIWQTYVQYFGYGIEWDTWPADIPSGSDPNPSDDLTEWGDLEFAVFASAQDNIDTPADAESNGTLVKDWHSENATGAVGYADYTASMAGERRYINVFVRDQAGNGSAYGSVRMESRVAPLDIYVARLSPLADEVWLNQFDGAFNPSFVAAPDPPPAILTGT
ncbi:MAG: hypothetical protein V3S41_08005, partial [Spirochaetia bacterium]